MKNRFLSMLLRFLLLITLLIGMTQCTISSTQDAEASTTAVQDIIGSWVRESNENVTIHFFSDGTYAERTKHENGIAYEEGRYSINDKYLRISFRLATHDGISFKILPTSDEKIILLEYKITGNKLSATNEVFKEGKFEVITNVFIKK